MLIRKDLEDWKYYANEINVIKSKINDRVKEIYNKIFKLSEITKKYSVSVNYYFLYNGDICYDCGACDRDLNELEAFTVYYIGVEYNTSDVPKPINFIDFNGDNINLAIQFPQKWLWNDFEQELVDGLQKYKDKIMAKQVKAAATKAQSKENKIKLQELIKSKLSAEKLEIISTWDEKIHWASGSMKIPAIIRLKYYVKYVQRRSPFSRLAIFRRDRYCCQYCGVVLGEELLTVDHVLPKSRGGLKSWTNMVTSCKSCNTFKNNRTPEEAGIKLIQIPFMPEMKLKHS